MSPGTESRLARLKRLAGEHQGLFWTLHSVWALGWGVAFMVVGQRRSDLLRFGLASIGVVWATSLVLPALLAASWLPEGRKAAARTAVLYGQKWLLQGLGFFILPIYHRSATYPSRNTPFMVLLAAAALAATIDFVYDEVVTRQRLLQGAFLAFVAFACVDLMLPMIWKVGGVVTPLASAGLATAVFVSFRVRPHDGAPLRGRLEAALVASVLFALALLGAPFVPPAPLRLVSARFATALAPGGLEPADAPAALAPAKEARVHLVAAVQAPAGLAEGVRHVWSVDGRRVYTSRPIGVVGGRALGFRSRSTATLRNLAAGQVVTVDVETVWGELIGRTSLPVGAPAAR